MCAVLDLVDNKGLSLSYALWVACVMIPPGGITRGSFRFLTLFMKGVSTLMWFFVVPVSADPYIWL